MSDILFHPQREKGEPQLPTTGLLCPNPSEANHGGRLAKEHNGKRFRLFNSNLHLIHESGPDKPFFVSGPAVGAPMAVLTLEKLIALGAQQIIVYGWCGSLQKDLQIGDVLLPTWAVSEEGTSGHYPIESRPESSSQLRTDLAAALKGHATLKQGGVWTTDAPYRETRTKVRSFRQMDIWGVDMEYAALCTVSAFRGVKIAAVLLVSDELWREPWQPGFKSKEFKHKSRTVLELLFDFCGKE